MWDILRYWWKDQFGGGSGDSGVCVVREGSKVFLATSHQGLSEEGKGDRDSPKVIAVAGLNSTISPCHSHLVPAENSDTM